MTALAHGHVGRESLSRAAALVVARLEAEGSPSRYDARSLARLYTAWAGSRPASTLTVLELRAEVMRLRQRLSPSRVRAIATWWCTCLREIGIDLTPRALFVPRRLRDVDARQLLDAAWIARLTRSRRGPDEPRAMVAGLLLTGARGSEARGWRVSDVDTSGATWVLTYDSQLHAKSGARSALKDRVAREVPVHPEWQAVLERIHGPRLVHTAPARALLPGPTGRAYDDNTLRRVWYAYLEAHDAPRVTPHTARHSAISAYRDAGADRDALRSITHPASPTSDRGAFGRYVHITRAARVRAVLTLRLPVVEVLDDATQLELRLEAPCTTTT